jgi:hypothetical protein
MNEEGGSPAVGRQIDVLSAFDKSTIDGGIFKPILDAIAKRTPKMLHDFAWTAFACSVRPDIVEDAKVRLDGNGEVRIMIEDCVRRLFSHDVDGEVDGDIDHKVDLFWDELKHFQNR